MALGFAALVISLLINLAGCGDPQVCAFVRSSCCAVWHGHPKRSNYSPPYAHIVYLILYVTHLPTQHKTTHPNTTQQHNTSQRVQLWALVSAGVLLAFGIVTVSSPNASLFTKMVGEGSRQGRYNSLAFLSLAAGNLFLSRLGPLSIATHRDTKRRTNPPPPNPHTRAGRCLGPLLAGLALAEPNLSRTYYPFFALLLLLALGAAGGLARLWPTFARVEDGYVNGWAGCVVWGAVWWCWMHT